MKRLSAKKSPFFSTKRFFSILSILLFLVSFSACKKNIDYFDYVSECRSNIFIAETDEYRLRIYAVTKEIPYVTDGIPKELSTRTEVFFIAPSGDKDCSLYFTVNGKEYGGELSYDNVKAEYYYSCTLDASACRELSCRIQYGDTEMQLRAASVLKVSTLSAKSVLYSIVENERELFTSLTDKYGFAGEIYLRLIYEDSPYYYLGVIDHNGNVYAFLINAETGKILAKRQS